MKNIFILCLLSLSFWAQAQSSNNVELSSEQASELTIDTAEELQSVVIRLKNGSVIRGKIVSYQPEVGILLRMNGTDILIPENKIRKFVILESSKVKSYVPLTTKKIYYRTSLSVLGNENGNGGSLNISALYQFNKYLSAGIGFGMENYYGNEAHNIYPLFTELKTYLVDKKSSPFVSLKTGYSFNRPHKDSGQVVARGGLLINPTFGYRFGSQGIMFDLYGGYRFQEAYYEKISRNGFSVQEIIWKRIEVGAALSF